jgi:hypothetical protein
MMSDPNRLAAIIGIVAVVGFFAGLVWRLYQGDRRLGSHRADWM